MSNFSKSRREFIKTTLVGGAGLIGLPTILPRSVFGAASPSKLIQVAQIGCGREGRADAEGVMAHALGRVVAVCDLDSKRVESAKTMVTNFYKRKGESQVAVQTYHDYHEVLARPEIDAVIVSTPDHWHALVTTAAALAGKHIYCQKPITYNIAESIAVRSAVRARKVIFQAGSQQRSAHPFAAFGPASEAVRNGRIGQLKQIEIGIGLDKPSGKAPAAMPVPANLDYERWLGPAPEQPYMEGRVHPQNDFGRPGWITTEDFGLGMITNWGAHHVDIAQWAMGMELSGPSTIEGRAEMMKGDVWTVHGPYHVEMQYANGVQVVLDNKFPNGLRFVGTEGWVFCSRGAIRVTSSDGNAGEAVHSALQASDEKILTALPADAKRWPASSNHYLNWLESIVSNSDPVAPVEQAGRSLQACATAWIGMKLKRKLTWDPAKEEFVGDPEANSMRDRKPRKAEYDLSSILKQAGLKA